MDHPNKKRRTCDDSKVNSERLVALRTASFSHIGRRNSLEDFHISLDSTQLHQMYPLLPSNCRVCLYGVLDGHGGKSIAEAVSRILPDQIIGALTSPNKFKTSSKAVTRALQTAFQETEKVISQMAESSTSGCCAVVILIVNNNVHVANLGDSKAVLCRQLKSSLGADDLARKAVITNDDVSGSSAAVTRPTASHHSFPWSRGDALPPPLAECVKVTVDHRPVLAEEKQRVVASGGCVEDGRIYSPPDDKTGLRQSIGVARSFGDKLMKRYGMSCQPDLRIKFSVQIPHSSSAVGGDADNGQSHPAEISSDMPSSPPLVEFILLACDGLWERYSEASALAFVRTRLHAGSTWCRGEEYRWSLDKICRGLVEDAVFEKGCQDNVSVLLIEFRYDQVAEVDVAGD